MHSYLFPLLDVLYHRQVESLILASEVYRIRELGTQWHQREIPSLFIYLIYHTNGNKQAMLWASLQALSDWPVLSHATLKVYLYLK